MRFRPGLPGLLALSLLLSCKGAADGVASVLVVASVDVQPGITDVVVGQTRQLSAIPKTSSGISVPGRSVVWSSTDPLIASVSSSGLVQGVALGGPVRIRATVDGAVGDALVTVRSVPVDRVTVTPASSPVLVAGSVQLTATAFDAVGNQLAGRSFLWESNAPSIAAVTTTGIVIGLAEGGPVTISAISEGKTGSATVSVSNRPATRLAFAQQPGPSIAGQPLTPTVRIALQDDLLTTVIGASNPVTISLAGNPTGATLSGATTVNPVNGIVSFNTLSLNRVGTGYTFLVTSPGLIAATSIPFNVTAGAASQLSFTVPPPSSTQSGLTFGPQPVLQLRDAAGNPVAQNGVVITAALASGGGSLGGITSATTNTEGIATFGNLSLSGPAGTYTLSFSAPGLATLVSGPVSLGFGAATGLAMVTQPTSAAQSGIPLGQQPSVQLKDGSGNSVGQAGVVVTATIASGSGTLGGSTTATTNSSGLAQFTSLAINGPSGTYTLGFGAPGLTGVISASIILGAGAPTQLAILTQPSSAAASGVAFSQQPTVQIRDGSGNPVSVAGVQVTAGITSGGGTLSGTTTVTTNASGNAVFTNLAISGPVGGYSLTFTSSGLTSVASGSIALGAGPAAQLGLATQPTAAASSGVAFPQQPVVQIRDAAGNPVAQGGVLVTVTLASGPGGTLGGTTTASSNGFGAATFSDLSITGPSGTYTLRFTAPGLTAVTSSGVTLGAGAATQLAITTQPSSTAQSGAGFAQQPVIQLRDAANNPVAQSGIAVTATIASGGGTLGGTATATTNASGIATFTNLSITGVVGARTLAFAAPGVTGATSSTITLSAGAATQLSMTTQPSNLAQSGVAFAQQPAVQLRDAAGNAVSQAGVNISVAIASGGGTLGGSASVATNAAGLATFAGLSITGTAGDRTLGFSSAGLTGATSSVITITAGAPSQLAIATQPSAVAQTGVAFAQQPVIQLRDASSNPVSQAGVVVTASISSGGGTLGGTATASTNGSGVATFTNLSITGTAGDRTLLFVATGFTSVTSGTVTITAGGATQLSITTQPSASAQSGVAFAQQPVIQLRDGASNPVSQAGVVVTANIASGGGSLGGAATATTNASGTATFSNLSINGITGNRTLSFSAPGVTSVTSATISLSPGPATQLGITTQPSASAQSGVAFGQQPAVQLRDAAGNAVSQAGVAVTASIATGPGGTLAGATTVTTGANGVATFANLSLSGATGSYTLGFASTGLASATSSAIAVSSGAGSTLGITTQPSASAQNGATLAQQPVIQLRDGSNNPVAQAGVVVTATIQTGGGSLGGTPTATTNASGVATFSNLSITGTAGDRTLLFAAAGYVSVASGTITITAGPATQLTITTQPSATAPSGAALAQQPVLQLRDASGNAVSQAGIVVTAVIATGGGTLGGSLTATTSASGVATFTNLSITGTAGDRTLGFSATGVTGATSNAISITTGGATQLGITTQPSATAQSGAAFAQQPVIQLRDGANTPVSQAGVVVTVAIASGGGTLGGTLTATTNASGVATFTNLSITGTIGNRTLGFSAPGLTGATSNTINITPGAASQLGITTQPSANATSGVAFPQQPVIQLRDGGANAVSQAGVVVTASIATGTGTLGGTVTATTNASGVASFTNLSLTGASGNFTLNFAAPSLTAVTSNTIALGSGGATQLSITTQPSATAQSGAALAQQPVLQLRDAANSPVSQAGVVVTAAIASGGGTLGGTLTATTNASGVATFTNLSITGPAGDRTLGFSAPSLTGATSGTISITAGAAAIISANSATSQSAPVSTAVSAPPSVKVTDTGTNPIAGVAVTFAVTAGGGTVVPAGPATVTTNASGIATATSWTLGPGAGTNNNTVTATVSGLTGSPVTFTASGTAAGATQLGITTQPSATAQSGAVFGQQPVIQLRDGANAPVSQAGVVVTVAIASGGGTLGGTLTATTNASGVATFTNLSITGTIGSRTLGFSAPSLSGATSGTINITAGAAAIIAANSVTSQSAPVSTAVSAPPSVKVTDTGTNPIAGVAVTFAVTAGGGTVVPAGPTTVSTNASGIATATSWTLGSGTGTNNNTVTATASGLTGSPVSFTASGTVGTPTQLTYDTQPSTTATNNIAFATQPALRLRDANGNNITGATITATISGGPAGASFIGSVTAVTASNGRATFSGLGLVGLAGSYSLTFTANGGALSSTASSIALSAGAAAIISANSATSQSATVGTAVSAPPSVKVTDTGNNPIAGVAVTFAVASGGGTVVPAGPATVTTNASGIATATSWTLGPTAGTSNNTVTASAGSLTGSPVTFTASGTAASPSLGLSALLGLHPLTFASWALTTTASGAITFLP